ncbi:hypothetical protein HOF40_00555 [Candidatus Parcubacteria bacterium]|jgi:hypothetical protein|nr:hypothetical protein [Candidatus Parcubacteria bacterium]MBT3948560.1 hypothetical protein [Candidatus Parcubacteria bacterium]
MNAYSKKKQTLRQKKEAVRKVLVSTTFRSALCVLTIMFGFMYVWQTNTVSTKGYQITDLERQVQGLEYETRKLDVDIAQYKSMQNLQERLSGTSLVAVTDVDYMTVMNSAVAKR